MIDINTIWTYFPAGNEEVFGSIGFRHKDIGINNDAETHLFPGPDGFWRIGQDTKKNGVSMYDMPITAPSPLHELFLHGLPSGSSNLVHLRPPAPMMVSRFYLIPIQKGHVLDLDSMTFSKGRPTGTTLLLVDHKSFDDTYFFDCRAEGGGMSAVFMQATPSMSNLATTLTAQAPVTIEDMIRAVAKHIS